VKLQIGFGIAWLIASVALVWICHEKIRGANAEVDAAYEFCHTRLAANDLYHQQQRARVAARAETTEEAAQATLLQASEVRENAIEKLGDAIRIVRHAQQAVEAGLAQDRMAEESVDDAYKIVENLRSKINVEQRRIVQAKTRIYR
jgi:hypothetical protein